MLRSTALLTAVTVAAVAGAAGCGNSDDETSAPPTATAAQAASKAPGADKLDAADAAVLRGVLNTVAQYCSGHKATTGEVTGAVATLESLYEIDPAALGSDGKTVKQTAVAVRRALRACGDRSASRRVGKLTG
jgi:predicted outer membrane protein